MARKEQIEEAAKELAETYLGCGCDYYHMIGFGIEMAEWADANPSDKRLKPELDQKISLLVRVTLVLLWVLSWAAAIKGIIDGGI